MRMNRRNVLVGLGTIVAGGGAALGTGAFSSVKADRTVTVNTAGDSGSLIALNPAGDGAPADSGVVQLVDGLLTINFGAVANNSEGVNLDALTTVGGVTRDSDGNPSSVDANALTVTNNSSQPVVIEFAITFDSSHGGLTTGSEHDILKLWTDASTASNSGFEDATVDFGNLVEENLTLASGETANIALGIDTRGYGKGDIDTSAALFDGDATITANSQ